MARNRGTSRRRRQRLGLGEAALRGALAGLAGGAVLMLARRVEEMSFHRKRILRPGAAADPEWSELTARAGRRLGTRLSRRQRAAMGVGAHLAYTALLGALFGVLQARADRMPGNLPEILEEVLMFAANAPRHRMRFRSRRAAAANGQRKSALPVEGGNLFGTATAAAFRALLKV